MKLRFALMILIGTMLAGCNCSSNPAPGSHIEVQIRRDMLGAAAPNGIPPLTSATNGASTSVQGKLISIDRQWLVVEIENQRTVWIPRSSVLLVQIENN